MREGLPDTHGPCDICGNSAVRKGSPNRLMRDCPRCGTYAFRSDMANGLPVDWLKVAAAGHMVRLSGWVRDQNDAGSEYVIITRDILRRVSQMRMPRLRDRAGRLLVAIAKEYPNINDIRVLRNFAEEPGLQGRSYSADADTAWVLIKLLTDQGYLRNDSVGAAVFP
jgi:hypothetical protein